VPAGSIDLSPNRRRFVTWAAGSAAGVILSSPTAGAQSPTGSSGSRSLVRVHLAGGADGWNAAVPQSVAGSSGWNRARPTLSAMSRVVTSVSRDAYFATMAAWHRMAFGDVMRTFPGVTSAAALSPVLV